MLIKDCKTQSKRKPLLSGSKKLLQAKPNNASENDFRIKYKTELCKKFRDGQCEFDNKCAFAHGEHELRVKVHVDKKYKTKKCENFFHSGFCLYGARCQFVHSEKIKTKQIKSRGLRRLPVFIKITKGSI